MKFGVSEKLPLALMWRLVVAEAEKFTHADVRIVVKLYGALASARSCSDNGRPSPWSEFAGR